MSQDAAVDSEPGLFDEPEPDTAPVEQVKPAPEPVVEPEPDPVVEPEPVPVVEPAPEPVAAPAPPVEVVGVRFERMEALRTLSFVNNASAEELEAGGIKGRPLKLIVENRPFANLPAIGEVKGLGKATLESLKRAASA